MAQMKKTEQNSRKRTKLNGDKQPIRYTVQTLVTRMLKELIGYLNSIKEEPGRNEGHIK